jgi:hypothetical protein
MSWNKAYAERTLDQIANDLGVVRIVPQGEVFVTQKKQIVRPFAIPEGHFLIQLYDIQSGERVFHYTILEAQEFIQRLKKQAHYGHFICSPAIEDSAICSAMLYR